MSSDMYRRGLTGMVSEDMLMERQRRAWEEDERADMDSSLRREEERDLKLQVLSYDKSMFLRFSKDVGAVHVHALGGTLLDLESNELVWSYPLRCQQEGPGDSWV
jgi:hypothetical protein